MILGFMLALYAPVWLVDYFYHDDLLLFLKSSGSWSGFAVADKVMAHGRFVAAGLISCVGWMVHTQANLKWLRLANVLMLAVFGSLLSRAFARIFNNDFRGLLAALVILTLPAFSLITTWASNALIPLTLILAWLAAQTAVEGRP